MREVNTRADRQAALGLHQGAPETARRPIDLQFRRVEEFKSFSIPYYGVLRIPSLERVDGTPDRLDEILAPSKRPLPAI